MRVAAIWVAIGLIALSATAAPADSCWTFGGSLLRLKTSGASRAFSFEKPKKSRHGAAIMPGAPLFEGRKSGARYVGFAWDYSAACPGAPVRYDVAGPVGAGERTVTLFGTVEIRDACQPTGRYRRDKLVFTRVSDRC